MIETKAQRSALHVAMLTALGVTHGAPQTASDGRIQAFCEVVCWSEHPGEILESARAIDGFVAAAIFHSDREFVEVDADDLRGELGAETVNLALRLCGICPRSGYSAAIWTDAPTCEPTLKVQLPANLLDEWRKL